jgi:hypothetical protein
MVACAEPGADQAPFFRALVSKQLLSLLGGRSRYCRQSRVDSFRVLYAFNRQSDKADHISGLS